MLMIKRRRSKKPLLTSGVIVLIVTMIGGGLYLLTLVGAPVIMPVIAAKPPIVVSSLSAPSDNRIVIPKIGVNIAYDKGVASLDRGAEWRYPDRGNPATGGNFIIAAHRFSIQPTPMATVEKSPFYHIDKLKVEDKIIVDYSGSRYAYTIDKIFDVKPTDVEIEAPSTTPKLTLYTCELGGADSGRVVITGTLLGKVALGQSESSPAQR